MKHIIFSTFCIVAFAGCAKTQVITPNDDTTIQFGSLLSSGTKSAVTSLDGENLTIIRQDGATFDFTSSPTVVPAIGNGSAGITPSADQYFDGLKTQANFIAFYPAATPTANVVNYTIDGSTDIISAQAVNVSYVANSVPTCEFAFKHKLAQVKFQVKSDSKGVTTHGNVTKATINVPSSLDMTIAANGSTTLAPNATPANMDLDFGAITVANSSTVAAANTFMVLPQSIASMNITFVTYNSGTAMSHNISGLKLEAGKITTITANIGAVGVVFSYTIEAWEPGGTNGDIAID